MNKCKTCDFWAKYNDKYPRNRAGDAERSGGICTNPKLTENYNSVYQSDMLVYPYTEGGEFWTGPEFGCVHHIEVRHDYGR